MFYLLWQKIVADAIKNHDSETSESKKNMSDIKLRIYYLIFGGIGVALFLSMLSADFQDPTVFNQLYPSKGVQNWAGLIGALIGGFFAGNFWTFGFAPSVAFLSRLLCINHVRFPD